MIFLLEMAGTIAFAISGAVVGINKKMDIFGVAILAMTTAVGGGIIRDIILNITPPAAFRDPAFAVTGLLVGLLVFLPGVRRLLQKNRQLYEKTVLLMDSIGLGMFSVVGVQAAFSDAEQANLFLAVFVGVMTGVGGGVLRDVFAQNMPYIFVRHFYACASILGALTAALLWGHTMLAIPAGALVTVTLRLIAASRKWSLPRAKLGESCAG
jgi:uncharacterized membrane protein YeiH